MVRVRRVPPRMWLPDADQVKAVMHYIANMGSKRDLIMFLVQYEAALWPGELLALRYEDVDWRTGAIMVRPLNIHRRAGWVAIPKDTLRLLQDYVTTERRVALERWGEGRMDEALLFVSTSPSTGAAPRGVSTDAWRNVLRRVELALELPHLTTSVIRHWRAIDLSQNNMSRAAIIRFLAHPAQQQITMDYYVCPSGCLPSSSMASVEFLAECEQQIGMCSSTKACVVSEGDDDSGGTSG